MGVKIEFRGVGLFVCDSGKLEEVIFPNAERQPPWVGSTNPWKHPDDEPAVRHFAGIVIEEASRVTRTHHLIFGRRVMIGASANARPAVDPSVGAAFSRLDTLPGGISELSPANSDIAARIQVCAAGTLRAHHTSQNRFTLHTRVQSHLSLMLELEDAAVDITGAIGRPIRVTEDDRVAFYNYEVQYPTFADLYADRKLPCSPVVTDHDYKWLYALLRDAGTGGRPVPPFLAPTLECGQEPAATKQVDSAAGTVTVSVSTCFPGLWGA